jgi:uncharacterized SAM-binding protein YcdF (DUF218 family)
MEDKKQFWGLVRRRQCLVPTWRGWLTLLFITGVLALLLGRQAHSFLAVTAPVPGGVLVVEGWVTDHALEAVVAETFRNHYDKVFVTGGPLESGAPLAEYKTFAERGAAILVKLGLGTNVVQAIPAPLVRQDRTYAGALTLKVWLREHRMSPTKLNLVTEGPHARRSRLLFEKALGPGVKVGVVAIPSLDYDQKHWWRSSAGVRAVIAEGLAYGYARIFFHAPKA